MSMHPVAPDPRDDVEALAPVVRSHNAQKLRALIELLEPQVDGSYGPVNPRLIEVYLKALRDLAQLYRVYAPPPPPKDPEDTEDRQQLRVEALRAQAERQLRELEARTSEK